MIKIQSKRLAQFFLRHPIHTYYTDMYQQVHRQSNGASTYDQATAQRTENWLQRPQQKQSICSAKNKISYPPNLPPPPCPVVVPLSPGPNSHEFYQDFLFVQKKNLRKVLPALYVDWPAVKWRAPLLPACYGPTHLHYSLN